MQVSTDGQRGVDLAAAPLRVRGVDLADAPLRVRGVGFAVDLLRVIHDAATSGKTETTESDVPLACAARPSRSLRKDDDTAAATARKKMTPKRPEQRTEVPEDRQNLHDALNQRERRQE